MPAISALTTVPGNEAPPCSVSQTGANAADQTKLVRVTAATGLAPLVPSLRASGACSPVSLAVLPKHHCKRGFNRDLASKRPL